MINGTIADSAVDFWKTSGNDLFALSDSEMRVLTVESRGSTGETHIATLKRDLQGAIREPEAHYLVSEGRLFEFSVHPLYFGSEANGTLLGYVISGFTIDHDFLQEVGRGAGAEAAFVSGNRLIVSTLLKQAQGDFLEKASKLQPGSTEIAVFDRERYLIARSDVTGSLDPHLNLIVMKSFDQADSAEREINRLVFLVSLLAIVVGSILMLFLARMMTRPLEQLSAGVQAFGEGDLQHLLPAKGTREVRYLSQVFSEMRNEIQKTHRALLESERLATIGRMASSVSHDLRHYLAAVYANAEFLASPTLPVNERTELFEEIRLAVNGTTDMLDSLLIFSRTGSALQRVPTTIIVVLERAVSLLRTHPDAEHVSIRIERSEIDTTAAVDSKQMERAIFNLLLNACQSARQYADRREVVIHTSADKVSVSVTITDNGPGVAAAIRNSLFDPFVSQGKQKGTGLGLTLAWSVAREHGGDVKLISSRPGETIFCITVARDTPDVIEDTYSAQSKVLTHDHF